MAQRIAGFKFSSCSVLSERLANPGVAQKAPLTKGIEPNRGVAVEKVLLARSIPPSSVGTDHSRHSGECRNPEQTGIPNRRTTRKNDKEKREIQKQSPWIPACAGMTIKTAYTRRGGPPWPPASRMFIRLVAPAGTGTGACPYDSFYSSNQEIRTFPGE